MVLGSEVVYVIVYYQFVCLEFVVGDFDVVVYVVDVDYWFVGLVDVEVIDGDGIGLDCQWYFDLWQGIGLGWQFEWFIVFGQV